MAGTGQLAPFRVDADPTSEPPADSLAPPEDCRWGSVTGMFDWKPWT
jgi:hypothetical protein